MWSRLSHTRACQFIRYAWLKWMQPMQQPCSRSYLPAAVCCAVDPYCAIMTAALIHINRLDTITETPLCVMQYNSSSVLVISCLFLQFCICAQTSNGDFFPPTSLTLSSCREEMASQQWSLLTKYIWHVCMYCNGLEKYWVSNMPKGQTVPEQKNSSSWNRTEIQTLLHDIDHHTTYLYVWDWNR